MARKVFYSFHFDEDAWRAAQVRNMGVIEGNEPVTSNKWEDVKKGGDAAIKNWIAAEMKGKTCAVVLVGAKTSERPWVKYEIEKAWNDGLGVVGIRINGLQNQHNATSVAGANPFSPFNVGQTSLTQIVTLYTPSGSNSSQIYADIKKQLESLVESAIKTRDKY